MDNLPHVLGPDAAEAHDLDLPSAKGGVGKSTLTSRLAPRVAPQVVFRVADLESARVFGEALAGQTRVARVAAPVAPRRDDNGVAPDAEVAVDRAARGTGAPLPTSIQRQFEASLGADLSGVRVHTGGESAAAAEAVGAKAYTVGNDIHFGAGNYQPTDPFGMHLLAHEVAHTVQQAGGAAHRQHKLEVSTPQDAAEHEADRAADAMVHGAPFALAAAPSAVSRRVPRPGDPDYDPRDARLSQDTPLDVPNDPNDVEVVPLGVDAGPPRELNWHTAAPQGAGSLETVPTPMPPPFLTFNALRADWAPNAKSALIMAGVQCSAKSVTLVGQIAGFKASVAVAEQASAGVVTADPVAGALNITPEGSDVNMANAFKDDAVTVGQDKVKTKALEREDKLEIAKLKREVQTATGAVQVAHAKVGESFGGVTTALENVVKAKNSLKIASNDVDAAELEKQAQALEAEKGKVEGVIDGVKSLVDVARGLAKAAKDPIEGLNDMVDGAFDFVKTGATMGYDDKINGIRAKLGGLAIQNASLAKENAVIDYNQAVRGVGAALTAVSEANVAYKTAVNERKAKYIDLSAKLEKAVVANGGSAKDAAKVQAAVAAVPMIEEVIGMLAPIEATSTLPAYTSESGQGASMCTNLGALLAVCGQLNGVNAAAKAASGPWKKKLASVHALIGAAK